MKTRRLVSLLLAVLLIAAMIPSNALAAISYTGGTNNSGSTVEFKMSVSKSFGPGSEHPVTFAGDFGQSASITDLDSYMNAKGRLPAFCSAGAATSYIGSSDTVDGISQKIDGLYDASKTSIVQADGLNVGDEFYVGLKAKLTPQGDIKGIITTTFMLAYDSSKIEPVCSATTVGAMSDPEKSAFVKKAAIHADAAFGFFNDYTESSEDKNKYCGLYSVQTSNLNISQYGDDENGRILSFGLNCDKWYLPSATTWDVVIPFKAKKGGEATISQIGGSGTFSSSTTLTNLANGSAGTGVSHNADTGYNFTANDVTIFVNSKDVSMSVEGALPAGGTGDLTVTMMNTKPKDKTGWSITKADGSSAGTINSVTPDGTDDHKATVNVTLDNSITAGTALKLVATKSAGCTDDDGAVWPTGDKVEADVTVAKVPTSALYEWSATGLTFKPAADEALVYSKDGGTSWTKIESTSSAADKAIDVAGLKAAINGKTGTTASGVTTYNDIVKLGYAPTTGTTPAMSISVPVKQYVAPTAADITKSLTATTADDGKIVINTANENAYVGKGLTTDLSGTGTDYTTANGTAVALTTGLNAAGGITGKKVSKTQAVVSNELILGSAELSIDALTRPAAPGISAGTTSADDLKVGKTTITGLTSGTKYQYEVYATSGSASNSWTDLTASAATATLTATKSDTIAIRTAATATDFASATKTFAGKGNDYATVSLASTSAEVGATSITVNVVNGTWATNPKASVSVKKDGTGSDICTAAAGSGTTLTLTTSALEEGTYQVSIAKAALQTGGTNNLNGGTADPLVLTLTVSNNGFALEKGTISHTGSASTGITGITVKSGSKLSGIAKGGTAVFTLAGTVNAWEEIPNANIKVVKKGTTTAVGTVSVSGNEVTWTAPSDNSAGDPTAATINLEVNITSVPVKKTLALSDLDITLGTKAYDGGTDATSAVTSVAIKTASLYSGTGAPVAPTISAATGNTYTFASAEPSATADNDVTASKGFTLSASDYYDLAPALKTSVVIGQGQITKATASNVAIDDDVGKAKKPDTASVVDAIKTAVVDVNNGAVTTTLGTVIPDATTIDLAALVEAAVAAAHPASEEHEVDLTATPVEALASAKVGDTIKFTVDMSKDITGATGTGVSYNNGVVTIDNVSASGQTVTVTFDDSTSATFTITSVTAAAPDYAAAANEQLSITLDKDQLITLLNGCADISKYIDTITNSVTGVDADVTIKFTVPKKGGTPTPGGSSSVILDPIQMGEVEGDVEIDEEGKITVLPKPVNVVKGAAFRGWVDADGNYVAEGYLVPEDEELTLTAVYSGYMNGYGNGEIRPDNNVTRAEFLKMLLVAAGYYNPYEETDWGTTRFTDAKGKWYEDVLACQETLGLNIVSGRGNNIFDGDAPVTRAEAAKMVVNAFGVDYTAGDTIEDLKDFDQLPSWAKDYVAIMYRNETIGGYGDGTYRGGENIIRKHAAKMINRYIGLDDNSKKEAIAEETESPYVDTSTLDAKAYADIMFAALKADPSYYTPEITMPEVTK